VNNLKSLFDAMSVLQINGIELPTSITFPKEGFYRFFDEVTSDPRFSDVGIFKGACDHFTVSARGHQIEIVLDDIDL